MSQTRIIQDSRSRDDWMRELDHDAQQIQAIIARIDELAYKASHTNALGDKQATGIRLAEIREGLQLLCQLMGVKLGS